MAYVFGILVILAIPALIVSLIKPTIFKSVFSRAAKRYILVPLWLLVLAISLTGSHLLSIKKHAKPVTKQPSMSPSDLRKSFTQQAAKAPKSGALQYRVLTTLPKNKPLSGRITVITPEKSTDRIKALNDTLLDTFKADGQLTDATDSFFIDYFDDQSVAQTYFATQTNKSLSVQQKQAALLHYTAVMIYSRSLNQKYLFHILTSTKLKRTKTLTLEVVIC